MKTNDRFPFFFARIYANTIKYPKLNSNYFFFGKFEQVDSTKMLLTKPKQFNSLNLNK